MYLVLYLPYLSFALVEYYMQLLSIVIGLEIVWQGSNCGLNGSLRSSDEAASVMELKSFKKIFDGTASFLDGTGTYFVHKYMEDVKYLVCLYLYNSYIDGFYIFL